MNEKENAIEEAKRLSQSESGRKLAEVLRRKDPETLNKAMESAASGDFSQAANMLKSMLTNPEVKELLQKLGEKHE